MLRCAQGCVCSIQTPFSLCSLQEHALVLKTLEPLDKGRKCFKQTGDVLVERTVGDVLPDVRTNKQQLDQVTCASVSCDRPA